jgi:hypothetical protein
MRTDGEADRQADGQTSKLMDAFRNFANAPKNAIY